MGNRGPNILLILALFLAVVIIGGAVMFARNNAGPAADVAVLPLEDGKVMAEVRFSLCEPGEHCIVVDTHCGFCCAFEAINAKYEDEFDALFDKSCSRYHGQSCGCSDLSGYPSCINGRCQMVPWPNGG